MKTDPYIFRAYDIRGIYKKNLDEEVMEKIGFVLGKKKEQFVVGQDVRKSGKSLADSLIKGLIIGGGKVTYVGETSFGQALFAGWKLKKDKVLYITASHLPPEWNGLKIYHGDGVAIAEKDIQRIRDEVVRLKPQTLDQKSPNLKIEKIDIKKEYSDYLIKKFPKLKNNKIKIVVDCGNGAMCLSAPQIFKKFGISLSELYCNIDPSFSGRGSEPKEKAVQELKNRVMKESADFGVAFDGDGDRAVIIDDKGRYLRGDQIGTILAKNILKKVNRKKVIISMTCSMNCERELTPLGGKVIRVPVGHTFMTINVKKHNAVFGMEESGHIVIPQYFWFDDALLVPLKIMEVILEENKKLSQLVDETKIYPFKNIEFNCSDEIKFKVVARIKKKLKKEYKKVDLTDGIKVSFDYGWILIRDSNTSPIIRLYIEAENDTQLKKLKDKFSKVIKKEIYD